MAEPGQDIAEFHFEYTEPTLFVPPKRAVRKVYLHCTASDLGFMVGLKLVEEVNRWHLYKEHWAGVGYHLLIDKKGSIMTGRDLEYQPAAQLGPDNMGNVASIAITVHGNWEFTEASMHSVVAICKAIDVAYHKIGKPVTFHGHCEIDPRPCPIYDYKSLLGLDLLGNLFNAACDPAAVVANNATKIGRK